MTSRIADLCLGTDKDWKMGKTKIFLKVSCWEDWLPLPPGNSGMGGKEPQPRLLQSPASLWVPLAIDSCTGWPHNGNLGSRQERGNRQCTRENFPRSWTERWSSHERQHRGTQGGVGVGEGMEREGSTLHSWFLEAMLKVWSSFMPQAHQST